MSFAPTNFVFPYITGDGIGADITPATQKISNAAWQKVYGRDSKIDRLKLYAGQEALKLKGNGLPQETLDMIAHTKLAIKGPMATGIGGGNRSFNVALRKELDLYACIRPIKYYDGVPSMHIAPRGTDAVLFRENIEDVYSGIEFAANSDKAQKLVKFLNEELGCTLSTAAAIGIKNITQTNSERLIRAAATYAKKYGYNKLTLMHKGNIMKHTEGGFMNRGYDLIDREFADEFITQREVWILQNNENGLTIEQNAEASDREHYKFRDAAGQQQIQESVQQVIYKHRGTGRKSKRVVNDLIADNTLQQTFLKPQQFGVIATTNLNGDYESDAFAAVIGGLGVSPGANVNFETDIMVMEATHGTGSDLPPNKANMISHTLSAKMAFDLKGHPRVGRVIEDAIQKQLLTGRVTGDLVGVAKRRYGIISEYQYNQKENRKQVPGLDDLLAYAREQANTYTEIGTDQFADEICEQMYK